MFAASASILSFLEGESGGFGSMIPMFVAMAGIWFFIVVMPMKKEKKRKAEMMANLKKGERLLFQNGLVAKMMSDKGLTLVVESQGSKFEILKDQVVKVLDDKNGES